MVLSILWERVLVRFVRTFLSTFIPLMSGSLVAFKDWDGVLSFLNVLGLVTLFSFFSGALAAGDLYFRNMDDAEQRKPAG